jgi:hypothetical protein
MRVTLQHIDGTEQTVEIAGMRLLVDGCPLEIWPGRKPSSIVLDSPSDDTTWYQLVVSPGAANVIHLDVLPNARVSVSS